MYFSLIDKIDFLELGKKIIATKSLAMSEEYLRDHFPKFPVMPGVLMLEAMTQTSAWLIRASENFAHSMVLFKEAKNIKFGQFLRPGQTLTVTASLVEEQGNLVTLKTEGSIEDQTRVRAQLVLVRYNLGEENPSKKLIDKKLINDLKEEFTLLYPDFFLQKNQEVL